MDERTIIFYKQNDDAEKILRPSQANAGRLGLIFKVFIIMYWSIC